MENELPSFTEFKDLTEDERNILIIAYLRIVITNQVNHLKHHWAITMLAISAGLIGLVNLTIAMAVIFFRIPR